MTICQNTASFVLQLISGRIQELDLQIERARSDGRRFDVTILIHRREEAKTILTMIIDETRMKGNFT